jgi:hypothetical protein
MERGKKDSSSEYADEGTAAHFLASECLKSGAHPSVYLGRKIVVDALGNAVFYAHDDRPAGVHFEVDADMAGHVNHYVQAVRGQGGEMLVEQSLPIAWMTGEESASGTADAVVFKGGELQVHDLKYGMGERVLAENNPQLQIYGLAALEEYSMLGDFTSLRLFIHQPRVTPTPSEWLFPIEGWSDFADKVKARAYHALQVLRGEHPDAVVHHLRPAEAACRWCKAKADCPALSRLVQDTVGAELMDLDTLEQATSLAAADPESLSVKLTAVPLIETWCKAVRAEAERALFAGEIVPGYKVVQGKRGNRAWADATQAETVLKGMRLKVEEMYNLKLISPTTAEKLSKVGTIGPRQWKKVQELIVQPEGKPSVAPETDPRPPISVHVASEDLGGLDDGEDLA